MKKSIIYTAILAISATLFSCSTDGLYDESGTTMSQKPYESLQAKDSINDPGDVPFPKGVIPNDDEIDTGGDDGYTPITPPKK
ncbi:hypothetical protein [Flavobacterium sp. '19STA2R22 D10 B1']|uniref:hypothetical protein n=1 Tax=Flavobacterium aerium TaxID=3037261 RepID=UPI00278C1C76|nr:hypothetical protein [Flavobacterium sp. '19STA2R22 D10 B1']